jgi:hypothetical protein
MVDKGETESSLYAEVPVSYGIELVRRHAYDLVILYVKIDAAARGAVGAGAFYPFVRPASVHLYNSTGRADDRALAAALARFVEGDLVDIGRQYGMTQRSDFSDIRTQADAFAAADAFIEVDLKLVFDHFDLRRFDGSEGRPFESHGNSKLPKPAEFALCAGRAVAFVLLQDGLNAFFSNVERFFRMSQDDHPVLGFGHARCLELAVNLDKAYLAMAGNGQTGIVTESRDLNAVPGCNLQDRFVRKNFSADAIQRDGFSASIGC